MLPLLYEYENEDFKIETFPIGQFACNCSLIYSKKSRDTLIIDPGNDKETLLKIIERKNLNVKKLIHTHAHFDHIGRSQSIQKETGAPLYLHKEDIFLYEALDQQALFFGAKTDLTKRPIDSYIENEELFYLSTLEKEQKILQALHTPGHTPGSCCFFSESLPLPLLFSGDTIFKNSIGRTDLPGGNSDLIIKSIKNRLLVLPEETEIIPGHGPMTKLYLEKSSNPFLQ